MGLFHRLVLRVKPAHAHRFVHARQPQGIAHVNFATQRGTGHHQPSPFHGKRPVDRQTEAVMAGMLTRRDLLQMVAKSVDTAAFCRHGDKQSGILKTIFTQRRQYLFTHLVDTRLIHTVRFGKGDGQLRVSRQLQDRQMLARLRHHPVIARDNQQSVIDPAHAREHIGKKLLVAGHVDKAQHATVGLWPVGVTQVNGHAALFLFRQAIGIHARNGLQ